MIAFTMDDVSDYIECVRWRFANTMPDWPHEYTVKGWRPDLVGQFEDTCRFIAAHGEVEPWPPPPARAVYLNRYIRLDRHKYWAMGPHGDADPPECKTVINRALFAQ